ncbi:MAG: hypothetical protein LBH76_08425 [Propionibacteriaceae bacterium]|nr:hypothetical protein [Propionibacteriaceae bacterium]
MSVIMSLLASLGFPVQVGPVDEPPADAGEVVQTDPAESELPTPPGGDSAVDWEADEGEFLANQRELVQFRTWMGTLPGFEESGFVEGANYAESLSVRLFWRGEDDVLRAVLNEASARGITVTVEQRPMSRAEIAEAVKKVQGYAEMLYERGFQIILIEGASAFTLDIVVHVTLVGDLAGAEGGTEALRNELAAEISQAVGAPVRFEETQDEWGW